MKTEFIHALLHEKEYVLPNIPQPHFSFATIRKSFVFVSDLAGLVVNTL